jgi:hypothetical protein
MFFMFFIYFNGKPVICIMTSAMHTMYILFVLVFAILTDSTSV